MLVVVWMWWRWVDTTCRPRDDACCIVEAEVEVKVVDTTCRLRDDACCCVDVEVEVGGHHV